jgi:hypothetical protein
MKSLTGLVILLSFSLFLVSCFSKKALVESKTVILPLGDTIHLTEGSLVYGLPLTVFKINVEMEKTSEKPGPYSKFAEEMLGIKNAITQESEYWSIKGITVKQYEELDPSEFYIIETNTLIQSNALALKRSGLILDINPVLYEKTDAGNFTNETYERQLKFLDLGADEYFVNQTDTAFRLVNVDTAFIKIPYLVERKKQFTGDQLAEKAAKTLLELRDGKHLILTGEANVFPQNGTAIDEMNRLEKEYTALFAGKIWTEHKSFSYTLIPQKEMKGKPVTLFRFSELTGAANASAKNGIPVLVDLIPAQKTKDLTIILKQSPNISEAPKFDRLYYRIPDVVTINIRIGEDTIYNSRKLIYQFGEVVQLPANFIIGK